VCACVLCVRESCLLLLVGVVWPVIFVVLCQGCGVLCFPIVWLLVVVLSSVLLWLFVVLFPFCGGSLHCFVRLWWLLVAL